MRVIFTAVCHTVFDGLCFLMRSTYRRRNRALVILSALPISNTVGFVEFIAFFRFKNGANSKMT